MTPERLGLTGEVEQLQWLMGRVLLGNSREDKSYRAQVSHMQGKCLNYSRRAGYGSFLSAGFVMLLGV